VGARNPKQAKENAKAGDVKLNSDEVNFITKELINLNWQSKSFNLQG
jgi:aryl-alcohol dehydrogenase-like predicted oxidoreductase